MKLLQVLACFMMIISVFTVTTPSKPTQPSDCQLRCFKDSLDCSRRCDMLPRSICQSSCGRSAKQCRAGCERHTSSR